jgi:hypothetical protein
MGKASTHAQTAGNIQEITKMGSWTVWVRILGQMGEYTEVSIKMICIMVSVLTYGLMVNSTKVNGLKINNTVSVYLPTPKAKDFLANGTKETKSNG